MYTVRELRNYRTWEELSQDEKSRLIWNSSLSSVVNYDIQESMEALFCRKLDEYHLPTIDIERHWCLNNCQGDGCSISGQVRMTPSLIDLVAPTDLLADKMSGISKIKRLLMSGYVDLVYEIRKKDPHYSHRYTMNVDVLDSDVPEALADAEEKLGEYLLEYARNLCGEVEREGYTVIEEIESEKYLSDLCKNNGVLFDENGEEYWNLQTAIWEDKEKFSDVTMTLPSGELVEPI